MFHLFFKKHKIIDLGSLVLAVIGVFAMLAVEMFV